jgi:hypothetical protein
MSKVWIYIYENCEMCGGKGHCPGMVGDVMVTDAPCDICDGLGRRPTGLSFPLPYSMIYPSGIDEEMAAGGEPFFP